LGKITGVEEEKGDRIEGKEVLGDIRI